MKLGNAIQRSNPFALRWGWLSVFFIFYCDHFSENDHRAVRMKVREVHLSRKYSDPVRWLPVHVHCIWNGWAYIVFALFSLHCAGWIVARGCMHPRTRNVWVVLLQPDIGKLCAFFHASNKAKTNTRT